MIHLNNLPRELALKKAMTSLNEELLDDDPKSQAIEADEDIQYEPETDSQVVAVEPLVVTQGRAKRKQFLKNEVPKVSDTSS